MRSRVWAVALAAAGLAAGVSSARAADETTNYRVGPQHDNALVGSTLRPPLRVRWEVAIGLTSSNLIVAGGRVFFVNNDRVKAELTALDAATGQVLWSRSAGPGLTGPWALAYEGGRVFMTRLEWSHGDSGHVTAVAAATGAVLWERVLPESYGINAPPTVADGTLYVPAHDGSVYLYALRATDGGTRWKSGAMLGGNDSSPTLDGDSVYLAYGGGQVYSIARDTGAFRWHFAGCCSGGGGSTGVLHAGLLFESADGNLIHDAATGRVVGSFPGYTGSGSLPAFAGDLGLFMSGNRLVALAPDGHQVWAYAPLDPYDMLSFTLVAGGVAYVREDDQFITGVDIATGRPVFCAAFTAPPGSGPYPEDATGLPHAGAGMLLVPIGYGLVALESGGSASGCPSASGGAGSQPAGTPQSGAAPSAAGPALTVRAARSDVTVGDRVKLTGALSGVTATGGRAIQVQIDRFPFGTWRTAATVRTAPDGTFGAGLTARRNTRVRAVLDGDDLASGAVTVYAELATKIDRLGAGGAAPRVRVVVTAPPGASVRSKRVAFYLARNGAGTWKRVDRARWHALPHRRIGATGRYPAGRLGRRDRVLVCTRERAPDAFGRSSPLDPRCGRATLPRSNGPGRRLALVRAR
jgi:outer membrane protein assembly factor BamB